LSGADLTIELHAKNCSDRKAAATEAVMTSQEILSAYEKFLVDVAARENRIRETAAWVAELR